jgi:hypothetical protein
MKIIY